MWLPQALLTVIRPLRVFASSTMSSWMRVATCSISTAVAISRTLLLSWVWNPEVRSVRAGLVLLPFDLKVWANSSDSRGKSDVVANASSFSFQFHPLSGIDVFTPSISLILTVLNGRNGWKHILRQLITLRHVLRTCPASTGSVFIFFQGSSSLRYLFVLWASDMEAFKAFLNLHSDNSFAT